MYFMKSWSKKSMKLAIFWGKKKKLSGQFSCINFHSKRWKSLTQCLFIDLHASELVLEYFCVCVHLHFQHILLVLCIPLSVFVFWKLPGPNSQEIKSNFFPPLDILETVILALVYVNLCEPELHLYFNKELNHIICSAWESTIHQHSSDRKSFTGSAQVLCYLPSNTHIWGNHMKNQLALWKPEELVLFCKKQTFVCMVHLLKLNPPWYGCNTWVPRET